MVAITRAMCPLLFVVLWALMAIAVNPLPDGFVKEFVSNRSGVSGKFASNPRKNGTPMLLVASDSGTVSALEYPDESDESITMLDLRLEDNEICTNGERGLQSVAIDPNFEENFFVYVFYTSYREGCLEGPEVSPSNVVDRYKMDPETLQLDKATKKEIWRGAPTTKQNHNGGALAFGNDGKLYVTTGDGGDRNSVQPLNNSHGSIIRLNKDGSVPSDNPFADQTKYNSYRCADTGGVVPVDAPRDAVCSEVFANGLRNPFRIEMDPNEKEKVRFSVSDVGGNHWEELNWAGTDYAGRNYGYPEHEGPCLHGRAATCPLPEDKNLIEPFHWYAHRQLREGGCVAGSVVVPNDSGWPSEYKFLFADFIFFEIYNLIEDPDAYCRACVPPLPAYRNETFHTISPVDPGGEKGHITDIFFGPYKDTQALYIVLRGGKEKVIRIRYTGDVENSPPLPLIQLKDRDYKYEVGEEFAFDGSGSSDPDGDELAFAWDFGDGTLSQLKEPTHIFQETGKYQVKLVVTDTAGISQRTSMVINIGKPPSVSILSPKEGEEFFVGEIFQLEGEAFNYMGERLDDSSLTWEVRKHHADHFHPFLDLTHGNNFELFPAPEPEDFLAATNSYLEIILKATDDNGLTTTVNRLVQPLKINVGIESDPPDIEVTVDAYPLRTSEQIVSWKNHKLNVLANDQPPFLFQSWWDGNTERERKITLEEDGQSVLAIYCIQPNGSCSSDEECCSGSCENKICASMASSSNDAWESSSNDAMDSQFNDEQDDEDMETNQIVAWIQDSWGYDSDTFLTTIIIGMNVVLVATIVGFLLGGIKRKKKARVDTTDTNDNSKPSAGEENQSQDEETGPSDTASDNTIADGTSPLPLSDNEKTENSPFNPRKIPNSRKRKNATPAASMFGRG
mmetsp:Transcript_4218/g.10012  ORF Transcript_4218/g.10012 Transcript_4218/m.10012 type:complete len:904 (-) Transcript_4218:128-2839(-)